MTRVWFGLTLALLLCQPAAAQSRRERRAKLRAEDEAFASAVTSLRRPDRIVLMAVNGLGLRGSGEPDDLNDGHTRIRLTRLASVELKGREAEDLWLLWRGLRNGDGAGCFAPGYLLDFYAGGERLLRSHVCFQCCNVTIPGHGIRSICGDSAAYKRFQKFVTRALPYPKTSGGE